MSQNMIDCAEVMVSIRFISAGAAYLLVSLFLIYLTLTLYLPPIPKVQLKHVQEIIQDGIFPPEILKLLRLPSPDLSFHQAMKLFPWHSYQDAVLVGNTTEINSYSTALLLVLLSYIQAPHNRLSNSSCVPPKLFLPKNCKRLPYPRNVGVLLQFGFDVDALEIHLHELDDLVDKFFIIESISTHSRHFSWRPLLWDRLKHTPAFVQFSEKIVHFVVDDADLSQLASSSCNRTDKVSPECLFAMESLQERLRWEKFLEWNSATNYFSDEDILGFGDIDEIPWRGNVFTLKHCEMRSDPVDIGIWFPMDNPRNFFASDFPVKGERFTLGDPTYWTLKAAKKAKHFPNRMRGTSKGHLVGGLHLSMYKYPPFRMLKKMSCTECLDRDLAAVIDIGMNYASGNVTEAEKQLWELMPSWKKRIRNYNELKGKVNVDEIRRIPWYLDCNKDRFPYFFSDSGDSRLGGSSTVQALLF